MAISSHFGVFGRYTYGSTHLDPTTPGRASGDVNAQSIQFGLGFADLGKKGAMGTLSFLIPFDVSNGCKFLVAGGGNGGTKYEIEATYFYLFTNNISSVTAFFFSATRTILATITVFMWVNCELNLVSNRRFMVHCSLP